MGEQMEITQEMSPATLKKYHSVFPDPDEKDRLCIRIEHGPFAGLVIAFGGVQLADEENSDGTTRVKFEYDMVDIPPDLRDKDFTDEEGGKLEMLLGQIYLNILNEELEHQKIESEDGTNRRYDFTKPII